jgi:hypothetical protein
MGAEVAGGGMGAVGQAVDREGGHNPDLLYLFSLNPRAAHRKKSKRRNKVAACMNTHAATLIHQYIRVFYES